MLKASFFNAGTVLDSKKIPLQRDDMIMLLAVKTPTIGVNRLIEKDRDSTRKGNAHGIFYALIPCEFVSVSDFFLLFTSSIAYLAPQREKPFRR